MPAEEREQIGEVCWSELHVTTVRFQQLALLLSQSLFSQQYIATKPLFANNFAFASFIDCANNCYLNKCQRFFKDMWIACINFRSEELWPLLGNQKEGLFRTYLEQNFI
jgi:hypothetical protein